MQRVSAEKYFSLFKGYFMREMAFFFFFCVSNAAGWEGKEHLRLGGPLKLDCGVSFFLFSKRRILSRQRNILCCYKEPL